MQSKHFRGTMRIAGYAAVIVLAQLAPRLAAAQQAAALAQLLGIHPLEFSAETRIGAVKPTRASTGFDAAYEWTKGAFQESHVRPLAGVDVFHADVRHGLGGIPTRGSVTSFGALAGARVDAYPEGAVSPYLLGGLTAHYTWANASDLSTEQDLKGTRIGFAVGGGAAWWLGPLPLAVTADVRHVFSTGMQRTAYTLGVRVQPRLRALRRYVETNSQKIERVAGIIEEITGLQRPSLPDITGVINGSRGVAIALSDSVFVAGSVELTRRANFELAAISQVLQQLPNAQIAVNLRSSVAHGCVEEQLAKQRIAVLQGKLIEAGIPSTRLTGSLEPAIQYTPINDAARGDCGVIIEISRVRSNERP